MSGNQCCFQNEYPDYDLETSENFLNSTREFIGEKFKKRIRRYQAEKLKIVTTTLKEDIFYDSTIYVGCAGFAYYYFTCALKNKTVDTHLLTCALQYIQDKKLKGKKITFLCGDAGPLALGAVITHKLGAKAPENLPNYIMFVQRLLDLNKCEVKSNEPMYGRAGYLFALLFVNYHVGEPVIPASHIEKVVNEILKDGKTYSIKTHAPCPLLWEWHDKIYLGSAHGVAGILYILLQARKYIAHEDLNTAIRQTLDWLITQRYKTKNFPSSMGSAKDRLTQWCHGAVGFVPLFILASRIYKSSKYMEVAQECGEVVWERGLSPKGYSICHGVSGNAYAFIQLYQASREPVHLYRAACFMDWVISEQPGTEQVIPDRPASLFEGLVGRVQFAHDILHIDDAKFPGMSLEPF